MYDVRHLQQSLLHVLCAIRLHLMGLDCWRTDHLGNLDSIADATLTADIADTDNCQLYVSWSFR